MWDGREIRLWTIGLWDSTIVKENAAHQIKKNSTKHQHTKKTMENKQKIVPLPEAIIISKMDGIWAQLLCFWSASVVMFSLVNFQLATRTLQAIDSKLTASCSTTLNSKLRVFSHFTVPNSLLLLWQCDQLSRVRVKEISLSS